VALLSAALSQRQKQTGKCEKTLQAYITAPGGTDEGRVRVQLTLAQVSTLSIAIVMRYSAAVLKELTHAGAVLRERAQPEGGGGRARGRRGAAPSAGHGMIRSIYNL
jgi:hypothetical protein